MQIKMTETILSYFKTHKSLVAQTNKLLFPQKKMEYLRFTADWGN